MADRYILIIVIIIIMSWRIRRSTCARSLLQESVDEFDWNRFCVSGSSLNTDKTCGQHLFLGITLLVSILANPLTQLLTGQLIRPRVKGLFRLLCKKLNCNTNCDSNIIHIYSWNTALHVCRISCRLFSFFFIRQNYFLLF